jgi:hypothetical protein
VLRRIEKFVQSLMSLEALAPVFSSISSVSPQSPHAQKTVQSGLKSPDGLSHIRRWIAHNLKVM